MDGVVVSNHGGRQVDGAIAALDALDLTLALCGLTAPDPLGPEALTRAAGG